MRFQVKTGAAKTQKTACLILPVYTDDPLPQATRAIDSASGGALSALLDSGDFKARAIGFERSRCKCTSV